MTDADRLNNDMKELDTLILKMKEDGVEKFTYYQAINDIREIQLIAFGFVRFYDAHERIIRKLIHDLAAIEQAILRDHPDDPLYIRQLKFSQGMREILILYSRSAYFNSTDGDIIGLKIITENISSFLLGLFEDVYPLPHWGEDMLANIKECELYTVANDYYWLKVLSVIMALHSIFGVLIKKSEDTELSQEDLNGSMVNLAIVNTFYSFVTSVDDVI